MNIPSHLKYSKDHEWVAVNGDIATVGITDHAQQELTDVVFVELPETDSNFSKAEAVAVVESVKAASDIYAPLSGTITEANQALADDPSLVNTAPYDDGWIYKMRISNASELESLMDAAAYSDFVD